VLTNRKRKGQPMVIPIKNTYLLNFKGMTRYYKYKIMMISNIWHEN